MPRQTTDAVSNPGPCHALREMDERRFARPRPQVIVIRRLFRERIHDMVSERAPRVVSLRWPASWHTHRAPAGTAIICTVAESRSALRWP